MALKLSWKSLFGRHAFKYLLVALCLVMLADIGIFYLYCSHYSKIALESEALQASLGEKTENEAIAVLTGDINRISEALALLRLRSSPLLIISGVGHGITLTDLVNRQGTAGVDIHSTWQSIRVETRSSSTLENAIETVRIIDEEKLDTKRLILVTSDYHMPRALRIFREASPLHVIAYPVRSYVTVIEKFSGLKSAFYRFSVEYVKWLLYRLHVLPRF